MAFTPKVPSWYKQYLELRERYEYCVVIFQLGDFYEIFDDEAEQFYDALNLSLTYRTIGNKKIAMCGFLTDSLDAKIESILKLGYNVLVSEPDFNVVIFDPNRPRPRVNRVYT